MYAFAAKRFQIQTPGTATFTTIAWMLNRGFVAVGGNDGALRLLVLNLEQEKSIGPSFASLSPWLYSQQLEGHYSSVRLLCWNEIHQKLASSDDNGLIIVWMSHSAGESWFEEMVNNRQKSTVASLKWSNDGSRIAIAYEDGQIILGSVDGNRLWNKDIGASLIKLAWNTDDTLLLLGLTDGEVHAYDQNGNFCTKVQMLCAENVEMETALKDFKRDVIVSMEWYVPTRPCKMQQTNVRLDSLASERSANWDKVPEGRPRFLIAYQNGNIQLMCSENICKSVSIVRLPSTLIICAQWSPDGSMFAVAGLQLDLPETERNVMHFISAYGERLQIIRLAAGHLSGIAWEASGYRIGALIDTSIYLVVMKRPYQWTFCGQTLVFAYKSAESLQEVLVFYETKMEVKAKRFVHNLCALRSFGDYCVAIFRTEELRGAYTMQLCDSIGTPVDTHTTNVQPDFAAINGEMSMAAGGGVRIRVASPSQNDKVHYVDEQRNESQKQPNNGVTSDKICAVAAARDFFLIARESGLVHRYSLPDIRLQCVHRSNIQMPKLMALNCVGSRLALVGKDNTLCFFNLPDSNSFLPVAGFERKEVWMVEWDVEKDDTLAIMEKQLLLVIRGTETEKPVPHSGRICQFKDLVVKTVLLDEVFRDPEKINSKQHFVNIEIKILKSVKELLDAGKISEAIVLIERNTHPKLWNILATAALKKLDFQTAEHAFVKLEDFGGIQFLKRLQNIHSDALKKAEVCAFLGDLEAAEKIYFENDRRDLAVDMLRKMYDWCRITQLLQSSKGPGDDILAQQTWQHVGDFYAERQKWQNAAHYYEQSKSYVQLARCYFMLGDFSLMETLAEELPEGHEMLSQLAEIFANYGLCEQAINCYLKCDRISEAFEKCIKLNKWDKAAELSDKFHLANVEHLLSQYAFQMIGNKTKSLAMAQLYRKAAKFLQAAKIVYEVAKAEHEKQAPPQRLKKLYVMGALLVEEYHEQNREKMARRREEGASSASIALEGLLAEDQNLSMEEARMIDTAWRGAEAFHFFMMAHCQLYEGANDAAMKTALTLIAYDDLLEAIEVYSLLALTSYFAEHYGICSKAFMKLETMEFIPKDEREVYADLAMQIFVKNEPKDSSTAPLAECPNCGQKIPGHSLICPNLKCNHRPPICVASGQPIFEPQFWLCAKCKHRAKLREIASFNFCPLCHCEFTA
uniref:WD repeat-containing protein 55 homolog n=1 Tax=Globodera rostochiensis TaxID=31243 RepID=A0A914HN51_GLORO